jgi:proline dehydrogenase
MQTQYHKNRPAWILNGYQSYLKRSPHWINLEIERTRYLDISLGLKLVRGAYIQEERLVAKEKGYESPCWDTMD